jgi:hypothetical protein
MDKDRWAQKEFKVLGSHNIVVTIEFLSSDYNEPGANTAVRTLDNGRLELLRIEPKRPNLPSFSMRWDQNDDSIDIDLHGETEETRRFAMQRPGYCGHKTERVTASPRTQAIDIETPATGHVFKGTITLNIDLGLVLKDGFNATAGFKAQAS